MYEGDRQADSTPAASGAAAADSSENADVRMRERLARVAAQRVSGNLGTGTRSFQCEICGYPLRQDNKSGRCAKHQFFVKDRKTCKVPGCTKLLNSRNTTGFCTPHNRNHTKRKQQTAQDYLKGKLT